MARKLLVVIAVAVLALLLWSVFGGGVGKEQPVAAGPAAPAAVDGREASADVARGPEDRAAEERPADAAPTARAVVEEVPEEATAAESAEESPERGLLEGRIVVLVEGARLEDLSGRVKLTRFAGIAGREVEVDVVDGRFELPGPAEGERMTNPLVDAPEVSLTLTSGELGAYQVIAADRTPRAGGTPPGDDGRWVLEAVPAFEPRLNLLAAEDGAPLVDGVVRLFPNAFGMFGGGTVHPDDDDLGARVAGPGPSPLSVPIERVLGWGAIERVAVGAPGRVWRTVRVDLERRTPIEVELERAGAVRVGIENHRPELGGELELHVSDDGGRRFLARPLRSGEPFVVDSLPPGRWRFEVVRGERYNPAVFADAAVEVVAGETVPVTLTIDPEAFAVEATFATELVVELPPAWGAGTIDWRTERQAPPDGRTLKRQGESEGTVDADDAEGFVRHGLDLGELPIGDYALFVTPPREFSGSRAGLAAPFRVDGSGRSAVVFDPPVEVAARVTDPGGESAAKQVQWFGRVGGVSVGTQVILTESEPGLWTGAAQAGPGQLMVWGRAGGFLSRNGELVPGAPPFEVVLEATVGVELRFLCDGESLDVPLDARMPGIERVDGGEGSTHFSLLPTSVVANVTPGRYRLTPAAVDGYLAPEPIEFEARAGEDPVVEIEYRRDDG